jgi:hypothetical protein
LYAKLSFIPEAMLGYAGLVSVRSMLGWTMLGWSMLGWTMLGWTMLGWTMLGWTMLGWTMLGWSMLGWTMLGWTMLGWTMLGWYHNYPAPKLRTCLLKSQQKKFLELDKKVQEKTFENLCAKLSFIPKAMLKSFIP